MTLYEDKAVIGDVDIGRATVQGGKAVFNWIAGGVGLYTAMYYVTGGGVLIPYKSNIVPVRITSDGNPGTGELDTETLMLYGIGAIVLSSLVRR